MILGYPCNRSCSTPWLSTGGSPDAAPSSAGTDAPAAALAGLSEVDGFLLSLPGIGNKVLATLLAAGNDAVRRRDYHALRCLCGVAPVTRRSGKSMIVTRRQAAHDRLRDAAYHWARVAAQRDPVSHDKYRSLRRPWPRTRARPALGGRPPAQRRLRDAPQRRLLRPAPCRDHGYVSRIRGRSSWCLDALAVARGREGARDPVRGVSTVLRDSGVSMLSRARIEGRARPPRGVNPYIRAPAPTCTYDGRTSRPIPTSPPVSVRTDRGMTVPARDSDGRARRTRRPANPCTCRAPSMTLILCGGLRKSGQSSTSRS